MDEVIKDTNVLNSVGFVWNDLMSFFFEVFLINRERVRKEKVEKYGFPYHSRGIFCKVAAFLDGGVVPVLVDGRLVGLILEVWGKGLGVVGWLVMTGDSDWNELGIWDDCGIPESGELTKRFGVEWRLLSLTGDLIVVSIRDCPRVSAKVGK